MFDLPAVDVSTDTRSASGLWLGEVVATFGLLLVILGVVRAGRRRVVAFAVGGYIAAAYWFTSSTSFANPAVTIGRTLSDTFAGIAPASRADVHRRAGRRRRSLAVAARPLPASPTSRPTRRRRAPRLRRSRRDDARDPRPTVLFLCVHNAGRSQMALGWFRHLAGDRAVAWSGGSEPGDRGQPRRPSPTGSRAAIRRRRQVPGGAPAVASSAPVESASLRSGVRRSGRLRSRRRPR